MITHEIEHKIENEKTYRLNDDCAICRFENLLWWERKDSAGQCWYENGRMIIGHCKVYTAYHHYQGGNGPDDDELKAEIDHREATWPDYIADLPQFPCPVNEMVGIDET